MCLETRRVEGRACLVASQVAQCRNRRINGTCRLCQFPSRTQGFHGFKAEGMSAEIHDSTWAYPLVAGVPVT